MPRLPVVRPTTIFKTVIPTAAITELPATLRFSARIASEPYSGVDATGTPHMSALSPKIATHSPLFATNSYAKATVA
jgi:hypothetical protein